MLDSRSNAAVEAAIAALQRGELVVYPTETLYGLGADADNDAALTRLTALKVRPEGKPVSVLVADRSMLDAIAAEVTPLAERLIARFWPGPLTLIVTARPSVSMKLTAGSGTIGVRVSSHPIATALVARLGRPITTPSANPAGAAPPTTVAQSHAYFGDAVAVYVDGGALPGGVGSTVVDVTGSALRVLREGTIAAATLLDAVARAA